MNYYIIPMKNVSEDLKDGSFGVVVMLAHVAMLSNQQEPAVRCKNSAFYLSVAALAHSTYPMMSHHNKHFRNHPALILQEQRLFNCFSPKLLSHAHTKKDTSTQVSEGSHNPTNQMMVAGQTIEP